MFSANYDERVQQWRELRTTLETAVDPLQHAIDFYNTQHTAKVYLDPWDQSTWPTPWELLAENVYCAFAKILAIGYTLSMTSRFSSSTFELQVVIDQHRSTTDYLLIVDNTHVIGLVPNTHVLVDQIPPTANVQARYPLPREF